MILMVAITVFEIGTLAALITALAGAYAIVKKTPKEADGLFISSAQGATSILDSLTKTLYAEIERKDQLIKVLETRIMQLEAENRGLREKYGERLTDPTPPPLPPKE